MSDKASTSYSQRNDQEVYDEVSFGDFTNIPNAMTRQELMEGDFSLLDGYSSVLNAEGIGSASYVLEAENNQITEFQQKLKDSQDTVRQLRHRLVRRTNVIEGIRKYYLRDVVTMKHILRELLSETERKEAWEQYEHILPSIDLKETLQLHAPERCSFQVTPCESCGGKLEVVMKDNEEVEKHKKVIKDYKEREGRWRVKLAELDAQLENIKKEKAESWKSHSEEKKVLYSEMKKVRDEIDTYKEEITKVRRANKQLRDEGESWKQSSGDLRATLNNLAQVERELEIAKYNLNEANDIIKGLRNTEKSLAREIQTYKQEIKEISLAAETGQSAVKNLQSENKQLQISMERLQLTSKEVQDNLEVSNQQKLELTDRIMELEENLRENANENSSIVENYEGHMEKLRRERKGLAKKSTETTAEVKKLKQRMEEKNIVIEDLNKVNHNQELELLDNAEEIELLEQEIKTMQRFVKQKIAEQNQKSQEQKQNDADHDEIAAFFKRLDAVEAHLQEIQDETVGELAANSGSNSGRINRVGSVEEEQVVNLKQRRTFLRKQRTMRRSQTFENIRVPSDVTESVSKPKRVKRRIKPKAQHESNDGDSEEDAHGSEIEDDLSDVESQQAARVNSAKGKKKLKPRNSKVSLSKSAARSGSIAVNPADAIEKGSPTVSRPSSSSQKNTPGKSSKAKVKLSMKPMGRKTTGGKRSLVNERKESLIEVNESCEDDVTLAVRHTVEALGGDTGEEEEAEGTSEDESVNEEEEEEDRVFESKIKNEMSGNEEPKRLDNTSNDHKRLDNTSKEVRPGPKVEKEKRVRKRKAVVGGIIEDKNAPKEEESEAESEPDEDLEDSGEDKADDLLDEISSENDEEEDEEEIVEEIVEQGASEEDLIASKRERLDMRAADKESKLDRKALKKEMRKLGLERNKKERDELRAANNARRKKERAEERVRKHQDKLRESKVVKIVRHSDSIPVDEKDIEEEKEEEDDENDIAEEEVLTGEGEEQEEGDDEEFRLYNNLRKQSIRPKQSPTKYSKKKKTKVARDTKPSLPEAVVEKDTPPVITIVEEAPKIESVVEVKPAKPSKPKAKKSANSTNNSLKISYNKNGGNKFMLETLLQETLESIINSYGDDELELEDLKQIVDQLLKTVGVIFEQSSKALWENMLLNKESVDLAQKLFIVIGSVLDCRDDAPADVIAETCSKLIPLAGATINSNITNTWQEKCKLDADILAALTPTFVDYETNARRTKEYSDVFSKATLTRPQHVYDKLMDLQDTSGKMSSYFRALNSELSKQLVDFLSEWSVYKSASKDSSKKVESEKEKLKNQYESKVATIGKELAKGTILLEKTMEKLKNAELKVKDLKVVEASFNELEIKHNDIRREYESKKQLFAEMQTDHKLMREEQKQIKSHLKELQEIIAMAAEESNKYKFDYIATFVEKMNVETLLADRMNEVNKLEEGYVVLVNREYARLNHLSTVSMQTEPEVMEISVQTEFLVPPMDLRTVVVDKISRSSVRNYPMVYSQSLEQLPFLSRGHTPGSALHDVRSTTKPPSSPSHRMSSASIFSSDSNSINDYHNIPSSLLAPHSPPISKYRNSYNEEDILSFLSHRASAPGGDGNGGTYSPRSVNSGHSSGMNNVIVPNNHGKGKKGKNRWGAAGLGRSNAPDKDLRNMYISNSTSPKPAVSSSSHIPSSTSASGPVSQTLSYSISIDTSNNRSAFNFDTIDISGAPSPVAAGRSDGWDNDHSNNLNFSMQKLSSSTIKPAPNLPEVKQIVYNNKYAEGKFRTASSKVDTDSSVNNLMITSTSSSSKANPQKFLASQNFRPNGQSSGMTSSSLGQAGLSSISNVNSDTIKKMRKELLSR